MRIAFVYDAVHPYVTGGAERRYHELGTRLAARGHDVHWFGMKFWEGPRTLEADGMTYHGVCRAVPLYGPTGRRSVGQALRFGVASLAVARRRFDVVDCCGFPYFSLFAARAAVAVRGGRLVSTWHEVWGPEYWNAYLGRPGRVGALVERIAARLPHRVVAASTRTGARFLAELHPGADLRVVDNGCDAAAVAAVPVATRGYDVVSAGRLVDFKDVELLLDAVALLLPDRPDLTVGVVGDGPHREVLQEHAADLGIGDRVEFTGFLPRPEDVYGVLKASGVFVLTSRREGFGIVALEAAAAGLPVVVAAHPDNAAVDLVVPGSGLVAAPEAGAVARAVAELLDTPPADRAPAAPAVAAAHEWDRLTEDYLAAVGAGPEAVA